MALPVSVPDLATERAERIRCEPRRTQRSSPAKTRSGSPPASAWHSPSRPIAQRDGLDHGRRPGPLPGQGRWPQPRRLRPAMPCSRHPNRPSRPNSWTPHPSPLRKESRTACRPAPITLATSGRFTRNSSSLRRTSRFGSGYDRVQARSCERRSPRRDRSIHTSEGDDRVAILPGIVVSSVCRHCHWACAVGASRSRASPS